MPLPDLVDLVQMLHHLDQPEHRADDADGGRESARRFEYLGNLLLVLGIWLSSSSSIILRSSCGSVPSTASISDFFRKGSSMLSSSASSETMPSRRALLA